MTRWSRRCGWTTSRLGAPPRTSTRSPRTRTYPTPWRSCGLRYLVELLDRPHAVVEDAEGRQFVWPSAFAYDDWAAVPDEDLEALRPLYGDDDFATFQEFGGYIGYRIGITEAGDWLFFIVGD